MQRIITGRDRVEFSGKVQELLSKGWELVEGSMTISCACSGTATLVVCACVLHDKNVSKYEAFDPNKP